MAQSKLAAETRVNATMGNKAKRLIVSGAFFGAIWLWARKGEAATVDMQLTSHFMRSEFLRSTAVPTLAEYTPTPEETSALLKHANYLEQIRDRYGPIQVTGGLRPKFFRALYYVDKKGVRVDIAEGISVTNALIASGYNASPTSDHIAGNGSDIKFLRIHTTNRYVEAFNAIKGLTDTRQVILYLTRGSDGNLYADHLHVSNVTPTAPKEGEPNYAWITIDGKRVTNEAAPNA